MFGFFKKTKHVTEHKFQGFIESLKLHLDSIKLFNQNLNQKVDHVLYHHNELDERHSNNIEIVKQWINYFNQKHKDTDEKFNILIKHIKKLETRIENSNKINEAFIKQIINEYVEIPSLDKDKLKKEIILELNYVKNSIENDQNSEKKNISKETTTLTTYVLTNSEKWLLNMLFNEERPLTYDQIAQKTGKSLNTIRVYMNSLKNKGNLVEENLLPNGIKVFSISNKEKIRRLYNIY